jgi:transposase
MTREEATAMAYGDPRVTILVLMELSARIEELERKVARLTTDSSNSSKPPSSDRPADRPKARTPIKSKNRKPGGQPGHKGSNRDLAPPEEVDEIIDLFPKTCEYCRACLTPDSGHDLPTGKYWRH